MAHRSTGPFTSPREVATVAVLPHDDRPGFAVAERLGFTSLADIAAARYPLRVSTRGSIDACTPIMGGLAAARLRLILACRCRANRSGAC